jgi:ribosomal protein S18 acetylase RimI-like enzyme
VTYFRSFRNGDSPALAGLWNRGAPQSDVARPLSGHEFDAHVVSKPNFDARGLIVAERDGRVVGFVHAGFGPDDPEGRVLRLNYDLGTIGMLIVEPGPEDPELERGLVLEAERYLCARGARVLYGGGQYPLNPFYWGVYGGSECAGVLSSHRAFERALRNSGYEPVSATLLMEADLSGPEVREPRAPLIRRMARVEVIEDAMPHGWWDALAIGSYRPTDFQLLAKSDDTELARASTWDMSWFGRRDGRARIGLIAMEVDPRHRRKGYGRHLVAEILRRARSEMVSAIAVQTRSTNNAAAALYQSLGFVPVETTTLFRLPAEHTARSLSALPNGM